MTDTDTDTDHAIRDILAPITGALDGMREAFTALPGDGYRSVSVSTDLAGGGLLTFTISAGEAPDTEDD